MSSRSYTSRRELEQHSFHPAAALLIPVAAIVLQVILPKPLPRLAILDLPLIVTIFFAVSRRSPIAGSLTGAVIGLLQDALTGQPIGINGIAKAIVGYIASSIGVQVDGEDVTTRVFMNFGFSLLNSVLLFLIYRRLIGMQGVHLAWMHELIRAVVNTVVAVPLFILMDNVKKTDV